MRSLVGVLVAVGAAAGCSNASVATSSSATAPVTISIVGTNDLHGALLPVDDRGGLARFAGYVANLRAVRARDGAVLVVDAGDMWQGTIESNLTEGGVVVDAYNHLRYTAVAIGNHEFDFGPVGPPATPSAPADDPRGALKARAAAARFPFLAANIIDEATGRPVAWPNVSPSTTVEAAGVTVGIIGLTTAGTLNATIRANTIGLSIAPLAATAAAEATRLRAAGATIVVVTAHAGGSCREFGQPENLTSCEAASEIVAVAEALGPGLVDVIVAGHTHAGMAHEMNGIAVIESFSRGRAFGRVDLSMDPATGRVLGREIHRPQDVCRFAEPGSARCAPPGRGGPAATYEGALVTPDPEVGAIVERAVAAVTALKAESLGVHVDRPMPRGGEESPLGNFFVDAMLASSPGADLAINNTDGGLRADLPAGPLTYGRLFEVFPFDNELVQIRLTGAELERVLGAHISRDRRLLGLAGARVDSRCQGSRLDVRLVRPSGAEIGDLETVVVATTDFLVTTDLFAPVGREVRALSPGPVLREAMAAWLRRRGGVIQAATFVDEARPRFPPRRTLPQSCRSD
ncbi:MAG TPA: bifunctional UDP-sugar hydrolase/5'-nucleotidase [Vicinamibacterales bacterium]|nr:bifunctional UDP-sugar hydrolase/5'-nucleotidase [Vicinamibacterales bacterium]